MTIGRLAAPLTLMLALALAVAALMAEGDRASGVEPDPVLIAAGDIASKDNAHDTETANLTANLLSSATSDSKVAVLGDNAYDTGELSEYNSYYDPTWGRFKARTMPSVGNHEYENKTADASGYFDYFSATPSPPVPNPGLTPGKGYYSYDLGSWHVVVLNSNCGFVSGGCAKDSPQEKWLRADLANTTNKQCTLAYWHHPRFASSGVGSNTAVAPFWDALYAANAEVVLNGHAHNYERFAPQTPSGTASDQGIREFIVGTGGKSLNPFKTTRKNSLVRLSSYYGVIKLTLHSNSYDWEFVTPGGTPGGTVHDSGRGTCDGGTTPPPTGPPTVTDTTPASGAKSVDPATPVTATFSEDMATSTINTSTFKLKQSGTTTNIEADVTYNPATRKATLTPKAALGASTTYKATVTVGAKDLDGNRLDQNSTTTGSQQKAWSFTVSN
jgi:Bacterial Ig-like domain/Calcineurin-like phosphoesterase